MLSLLIPEQLDIRYIRGYPPLNLIVKEGKIAEERRGKGRGAEENGEGGDGEGKVKGGGEEGGGAAEKQRRRNRP